MHSSGEGKQQGQDDEGQCGTVIKRGNPPAHDMGTMLQEDYADLVLQPKTSKKYNRMDVCFRSLITSSSGRSGVTYLRAMGQEPTLDVQTYFKPLRTSLPTSLNQTPANPPSPANPEPHSIPPPSPSPPLFQLRIRNLQPQQPGPLLQQLRILHRTVSTNSPPPPPPTKHETNLLIPHDHQHHIRLPVLEVTVHCGSVD